MNINITGPVAWMEAETIIPGFFGVHPRGVFCDMHVSEDMGDYRRPLSCACNQPPMWLLVCKSDADAFGYLCAEHAHYVAISDFGWDGDPDWEGSLWTWTNLLAVTNN